MEPNGNKTGGNLHGWLVEALREARQVNTGYALAAFGVVAVIAIIALVLAPKMEKVEFDPWQALVLIGMFLITLIVLVILGPRKARDSTQGAGQSVDTEIEVPDIGRIIERPTILWATTRPDVPQQILDAEIAAIEGAFPEAEITKEVELFEFSMLLDLMRNNNFDIVHLDLQEPYLAGRQTIDDTDKIWFFANNSVQTRRSEQLMSCLENGRVKLLVSIVNASFFMTPYLRPRMTMVASTEDMDVSDLGTIVDWMKTFYKLLAEGKPVSEACNQAANETDLPIVTIMRQSQDWIIGGSRQPTSEPS
jgi:hypothetical protein